jgi:hypothetical protein
MKHVLVLDSHNSSVPFLQAQGLKHPDALRSLQLDTEKLFKRPELLQSVDGIQFYHFTQKFPATNAGHFTGFEHLDKHLQIIDAQIAKHNKVNRWKPDRQEQLDAVVIPDGILEKPSTFRWLARLREQWPDLKVLVVNPPIHAVSDPLRDDVYVQALHDAVPPNFTDPHFHASDRNPYVPVQHNATNFRLHPAVDMATPNLRSQLDNALLLRHLVGLPMQIGTSQGRG